MSDLTGDVDRMNERQHRSNMMRFYGEENPLWYERLVQLMGKQEADEAVREAVDETIKEEVDRNGGQETEAPPPAEGGGSWPRYDRKNSSAIPLMASWKNTTKTAMANLDLWSF